jgi:hypothetical protein
MKKLCLAGLIVLLNLLAIDSVFAQSGRVKQPPGATPNTPEPQLERYPRTELPPITITRPMPARNAVEVPDYVVYETVFRFARTGWAPEKQNLRPEDRMVCVLYKKRKLLNQKQETFLKEVADETLSEVEKLDRQARTIIEEFRAKVRSGSTGTGRPAPPPELEELSKQKIAVIENAIERLKKNFGANDFAKFSDFVDENIRSKFRGVSLPIP